MTDMSSLLDRRAGESRRPVVLPQDNYPALVKSYEFLQPEGQRKARIRVNLLLTEWGASVPSKWQGVTANGKMIDVDRDEIDLSKISMRKDFDEDQLYRLEDLMESMGIGLGSSFRELLNDLIGREVLVEVRQFVNPNNNEIMNVVGSVTAR